MNQYAIKLIDNDTRDLYEYEVHIPTRDFNDKYFGKG
jgi:hypothetical protein